MWSDRVELHMLQFYIPKNFNSWFGCTQYWLSYLCLFYLIEAKTVVITTLNSLHHLVSSIKEETKKTKDIMYHSIKDYIELSLHLFSVYISQSGWSIYIYIYIYLTTMNIYTFNSMAMVIYSRFTSRPNCIKSKSLNFGRILLLFLMEFIFPLGFEMTTYNSYSLKFHYWCRSVVPRSNSNKIPLVMKSEISHLLLSIIT